MLLIKVTLLTYAINLAPINIRKRPFPNMVFQSLRAERRFDGTALVSSQFQSKDVLNLCSSFSRSCCVHLIFMSYTVVFHCLSSVYLSVCDHIQ